MEFNLKKILKALLFSTSESLSIKDVQDVIKRFHAEAEKVQAENVDETQTTTDITGQSYMGGIIRQVPQLLTATQIREAMEEIARELETEWDFCHLQQGPSGYRITTAPKYADWVRLLRGEPRPTKLGQSTLETLTIVAYRQPVTRAEIEAIRGVSADGPISKLLELEFIIVSGRAELPGRPIQYATTNKFLEFAGIRSIDELPASDVLSPNQISEWLNRAKTLPLGDKDMGLPTTE